MAEKISVLISENDVDAKIAEIGRQISEDYAGEGVHLLCILKGSVFFTCELAKRITIPVSLDFMSVSSYGDGTASSGIVKIAKDLDETLNLHIIDIPMLHTSGDIQESLDRVEEKIATWRNLMIEWRKSKE